MSGVLSNPIAMIGVFLLGGAAGALATFPKRKQVIGVPDPRSAVNTKTESELGLRPQVVMKALVVSRDSAMIEMLSSVFREKHIETVCCAIGPGAVEQMSTNKLESIILDFDNVAESLDILKSLRATNQSVMVIAIASESSGKQSASDLGANLVIGRPMGQEHVRDLLRSTYGRMIRDRQEYFRLAADLPVWVRRTSGPLLHCATLNLSQRGMAVSTPCAFHAGEQVHLGFAIPNADVFVSADGKVVWYDKDGTAGITFECSNPTVQKRYFAWLHDHFYISLDTPIQHADPPEQADYVR